MRGDGEVRESGRCKRQAVSVRKEPMRPQPNRISRGQSAPRPSIPASFAPTVPGRDANTADSERHCLGSNNVPHESTSALTQRLALTWFVLRLLCALSGPRVVASASLPLTTRACVRLFKRRPLTSWTVALLMHELESHVKVHNVRTEVSFRRDIHYSDWSIFPPRHSFLGLYTLRPTSIVVTLFSRKPNTSAVVVKQS
ncbi:hypothetical protein P171DRAFT_436616 [Karstenula rhodostoma CBS 690.94]|uniref:Uncharacterized protein n=1 Tax=Karstenula rhodostoma CBS 690.94 TaxID=1392251 RepID=A0A9P4U6E0_9PLEO|nr:hypothetical protein P171DRAFT_436616 [Karstenula rhodostoma CBS 690.94]